MSSYLSSVASVNEPPTTLRYQLHGVYNISKHDLNIDYTYQRPLDALKVRKMVADWRPSLCSVITVAVRPDGSVYTADGQHRVAAALERPEIDVMQCRVSLLNSTPEAEAALFYDLNSRQKSITAFDKYRASLVMKAPWALAMHKAIELDGRGSLSPSYGIANWRCIKTIITAFKRNVRAATNTVRFIDYFLDGAGPKHEIFSGLFFLEDFNMSNNTGMSLLDTAVLARCNSIGYARLSTSALAFMNATRTSISNSHLGKFVACSIGNQINGKRRKKLLISVPALDTE